MAGIIGGISTATTSFSLVKMDSLKQRMNTLDLGTNVTKTASELIDKIKNSISTDFSSKSMSDIKSMFNEFHSKLSEEHPDLLMEVLDAIRKSSAVTPFIGSDSSALSTEKSTQRPDISPATLLGHRQFRVTVSNDTNGQSKTGTSSFSVDGSILAAAMDGDPEAVAEIQSEAKQLTTDQSVTQITGIASATATEIQTGSKPQSIASNSPSSRSSTDSDSKFTISAEILAAVQDGNLGAIRAMGTMASATVVPTEKIVGIDSQTDNTPDKILAAAAMIRQFMAKQVQNPSDSSAEQVTALATGAIAKGIIEWISKAIQTDKKKETRKGGKSQEDIDAAIRKVKGHLSDGLDGLDELSQIAGVLCDIPMSELGPLLDDIKEALNEFLDQQMGQMSASDTRQLMSEANEIIGGMTGGPTLFSEDEINQKVAEIGAATPEVNPEDYSNASNRSDSDGLSNFGDIDAPPTAPSMGPMSFSKPKSLDLNTLQFNTSVSTSSISRVSAASNASGDTSSDRNGAQRKVREIVDFLEKLCETGLDQVMHQLTKQMDKTGLSKLIKEGG